MLLVGATLARAGSDVARRAFDVPADHAERSLKAFSEQSGCGVIFVTDAVKGLRTNPVKGHFTPAEALDLLLRNTGLVGSSDAATAAFAVRRANPPESKNVLRAAQIMAGDRPANYDQTTIFKNHPI
ncbi:MAG: hypothetical protein RIQ93_1432 [Verrucomicrobiota bacterium]|jgi:hypothetical protein